MFLTATELIQLTGYRRAADQAGWLKRNGVKFYRQRTNGRIVVTRAAVEDKGNRGSEIEGPRLDWIGNGRKKAA